MYNLHLPAMLMHDKKKTQNKEKVDLTVQPLNLPIQHKEGQPLLDEHAYPGL